MGLGYEAAGANTTGSYIVAIGVSSLKSTTAFGNTAIGGLSGSDVTSGNRNILIGYNTGRGITTGSGNTIIGSSITGLASNLQNTVMIGAGNNLVRLIIDSSGHVQIPYDDRKLEFGAAQDYSVQWDGDNAVHTITAGSFHFTGGPLIIGDDTNLVDDDID